MTTADDLRDKYIAEIERDLDHAEKARIRAATAKHNNKMKDFTAHDDDEKAWLRHADKHLRILADLMQERAS